MSIDGGGPRPGDFSVCACCGGLLRFGQNLALVVATEEDARYDLKPRQWAQLIAAQFLIRGRMDAEATVALVRVVFSPRS